MTYEPSNSHGPDPRCPYCGRPVLGAFVQGNEGRYHLTCTQHPRGETSSIADFFGTWPGDETDAELLDALRRIRRDGAVPFNALIDAWRDRPS